MAYATTAGFYLNQPVRVYLTLEHLSDSRHPSNGLRSRRLSRSLSSRSSAAGWCSISARPTMTVWLSTLRHPSGLSVPPDPVEPSTRSQCSPSPVTVQLRRRLREPNEIRRRRGKVSESVGSGTLHDEMQSACGLWVLICLGGSDKIMYHNLGTWHQFYGIQSRVTTVL